MDNFKITKTILENINEQNDRINECVDIVNGYTTDEETRVNQEIERQHNEELRQEQYNNIENRFNQINEYIDTKASKNAVRKDTTEYPINVSEFDTETKRLFTGGSVAVVGENAVGVENVKDEAITHKKRTVLGQHGILLCNKVPNFDLTNKTLTIPKGSRLRYDKYVISLSDADDLVLDISIAAGLSVIYYDIKENNFIINRNYNNSSLFTENSLYLGQVDLNAKSASLNTPFYTINDYIPAKANLNLDNIGCDLSMGSIICPTGFINFDFDNNRIIFPAQTSGSITVQYKNNYRNISSKTETVIDISAAANQCFVLFDIDSLSFRTITASTIKSSITDRECVVASFDKRGNNATMIGQYKINGKFVSNNGDAYTPTEGEKRLSNVNWQDITFVGNTMLGFRASDDGTAIETDVGAIYMLDLDTSNTYYKMLKHDFGHCNSVDYKEETDTLIMGNGSGEYNTDGEIIIIQGVRQWLDLPNDTMLSLSGIENSDIVRINVGRTFGDKVNVIWGENNIGENNICYVISNDIKNIRRVLLGKGTNQLENGSFIAGKSDTQFNGTYKVLTEYSTSKIEVLQGGQYYNGYLYLAMGHDGNMVGKYKLNSINNQVEVEIKQEFGYNADGTHKRQSSEGLCIKDGIIHQTTFGTMTRLYRYRTF